MGFLNQDTWQDFIRSPLHSSSNKGPQYSCHTAKVFNANEEFKDKKNLIVCQIESFIPAKKKQKIESIRHTT